MCSFPAALFRQRRGSSCPSPARRFATGGAPCDTPRTRRRALISVLTVAVLVLVGAAAFAQVTADKLFFIQRSKNANEVHYDARVTKDGTLDPKTPVEGYWLNKALDGSRSSIG